MSNADRRTTSRHSPAAGNPAAASNSAGTNLCRIRRAVPDDVPAIYRLIRELAEYERALDRLENTPEQLHTDGFGDNPLFDCFVAEDENSAEIVGISLTYFRYSTWKGRCLYLEDLIVTAERRGEGIGKALLERTIRYAQETGSRLVIWQVLDWNSSAIEFYKAFGAELQPEWVNCVLPSERFRD